MCVYVYVVVLCVQTKDDRRVLRAGVRWERRGRVAKQRKFPVLVIAF